MGNAREGGFFGAVGESFLLFEHHVGTDSAAICLVYALPVFFDVYLFGIRGRDAAVKVIFGGIQRGEPDEHLLNFCGDATPFSNLGICCWAVGYGSFWDWVVCWVVLICFFLWGEFFKGSGWAVGVNAGDIHTAKVRGSWLVLEFWADLVDFEEKVGWCLHPFAVAAEHTHQGYCSVIFGALDDNDRVPVGAEFGGESFQAIPVVIRKTTGVFSDAHGSEEVVGFERVEARQPAEAVLDALAYIIAHVSLFGMLVGVA